MTAYPVWSVLAAQSVVKVHVDVLVACAGCGGSVASGRSSGKWFVEAHLGRSGVLVVGEWCDVLGRCVEPSTSAGATGGVVYTHGLRVECVGASGHVVLAEE